MDLSFVFELALICVCITELLAKEFTKFLQFPGFKCGTSPGHAVKGLNDVHCLMKLVQYQCWAVQTRPDCQCCDTVAPATDNSTVVYSLADRVEGEQCISETQCPCSGGICQAGPLVTTAGPTPTTITPTMTTTSAPLATTSAPAAVPTPLPGFSTLWGEPSVVQTATAPLYSLAFANVPISLQEGDVIYAGYEVTSMPPSDLVAEMKILSGGSLDSSFGFVYGMVFDPPFFRTYWLYNTPTNFYVKATCQATGFLFEIMNSAQTVQYTYTTGHKVAGATCATIDGLQFTNNKANYVFCRTLKILRP